MHLVFLHLPLSVLFLNHTLWHDGGVGSRRKHQQELQQAREKWAIQSEHCLARARDKRWTSKDVRGKRESHVQDCTSCKGRATGCDVLSFPSTLYHSVSLFLVFLYTAASSSSVHAGVYIYIYTCRISTPTQAGSTWNGLAPDNDPYEMRWWCSPALLKITVYITTRAFRAN